MNEYRPQFEERREENAAQNTDNRGGFGMNGAESLNYGTFLPFGMTPEMYEEKREIKKTANAIGVSLIISLAIAFVWSFAYLFLMGRLGFSEEAARRLISDPAILQVIQVLLSIIMFVVPITVIFQTNGLWVSRLASFKRTKKVNGVAMYFIGIAFCAFANTAVSFADSFFSFFGIDYTVSYGENPQGFFGFLLCLLSTVAVPALVEEYAFRGLVLGSLKRYGEGFAIVVSALLFGLMHGNFEQMPFAFLVGLALGYITVKTESLLTAIAVHATNNAVSVVFDFLPDTLSQTSQNILYIIFIMLSLMLGVAALAIGGDKDADYRLSAGECRLEMRQRVKYFFTSPAIIIAAVVCILEAFIYF